MLLLQTGRGNGSAVFWESGWILPKGSKTVAEYAIFGSVKRLPSAESVAGPGVTGRCP